MRYFQDIHLIQYPSDMIQQNVKTFPALHVTCTKVINEYSAVFKHNFFHTFRGVYICKYGWQYSSLYSLSFSKH